MKPWRLLPGLCLWAGTAGVAQAAGVVLLSGATATEARVEAGLALPDGGGIDRESIALAARALGARDATPILWFAGGGVVRLDELPPDQRVAYYCATRDAEAFQRGQAIVLPAPLPLDPALWVTAERDRFLWWPEAPGPDACGLAVAIVDPAPSSVDFGDVALGASVERTVNLANLGRIEVTLGTLGASGSGFSKVSDACSGSELLPGQACAVRLAFAPGSAVGALAGQLGVPNSGLTPTLSVPLAGRGLAPGVLQATPASLAFGDVLLGATLRRTVQVGNTGGTALPLGATSVSGTRFTVASDTCAGTALDPAETCDIAVDFAPDASADFSATLSLARTDAAPPLAVALGGRGVAPAQLQADPTALAFGDVLLGATLRRTLQVSNRGGVAALLGATTVAGDAFVVATDSCTGTTLDPAEVCAMALDFTPAADGDYSASLSLARTDGAGPLVVALGGRGVAPALLQVTPSSLDFGDAALGASPQRTLQVSNGGGVDLPLGNAGITGSGFSLVQDACSGTTLAPAQACQLAVAFLPVEAGPASGNLSVAPAVGAALDVALAGNGLAGPPPGNRVFLSGFEGN